MRIKYIGLFLVFFFSIFILNYLFYLRSLILKKNLVSREIISLKSQLKLQKKDLLEYSASQKKALLKRQIFFDPDFVKKSSKNVLKSQGYCPLNHYPLGTLKVVGCLVADQLGKNWGLFKLPNGQICKVEMNDEVGIEKVKIIFIGFKKIIVQEKNRKKTREFPIKASEISTH